MDDLCFAIKDDDGFYYCGLNKWDKQLRKAQLFHSFKWAKKVMDNPKWPAIRSTKIVRVGIFEVDEYNPDLEL